MAGYLNEHGTLKENDLSSSSKWLGTGGNCKKSQHRIVWTPPMARQLFLTLRTTHSTCSKKFLLTIDISSMIITSIDEILFLCVHNVHFP